jgi:hypothetical protein
LTSRAVARSAAVAQHGKGLACPVHARHACRVVPIQGRGLPLPRPFPQEITGSDWRHPVEAWSCLCLS